MKRQPVEVSEALASRAQEVRERRGHSLRELARRLDDLGYRLDASALMRLERGERRTTVEDLLALSLALDVSPDALAIPLADDVPVAVTPGFVRDAGQVREWFAGRSLLLPPVDEDEMFRRRDAWRSERPLVERRAFSVDGVATLVATAQRYMLATGRSPDTSGSVAAPGERRRALEYLREEVDRQLAALDREES